MNTLKIIIEERAYLLSSLLTEGRRESVVAAMDERLSEVIL